MKKIALITMLSITMLVFSASNAWAIDWGIKYAENIGLGTREVRDVAVSVIQTLLGLLGILALIIVLIGGFRWMTSQGNEEAVGSAKKTIAAGMIGLIVIFFAYAIVTFVFNVVGKAV